MNSDLNVDIVSDALSGFKIDIIVTGSIGSIESVRFIRSVRRLGAETYPWLTRGGSQFITETSLSWASAQPVTTTFTGTASHIAERDACIVAPASANFIAGIATGDTSTPALALVHSYLGQNKPVLIIPNMHDSLKHSPAVTENMKKVSNWVDILSARLEEGKQKFPDPKQLADEIAHRLNRENYPKTLITMGTTRGYVDDVRYFSNYSSGALGTAISEELYRQGVPTKVISGPCMVQPQVYTEKQTIETNAELLDEATKGLNHDCEAAICAASVLDFVPSEKFQGKISSSSELTVNFTKTEKIIGQMKPKSGKKIGFKLESHLTIDKAKDIAKKYMARYDLSLMVINQLNNIDQYKHKAFIFQASKGGPVLEGEIEGKQSIASRIGSHIKSN
ncbi:MAG: hypothetical protein CMP10_01995 [Zetaproteobacteria bacterium]|nr:hypothetical protein [Pseudobdellovibrionaceae bacterium]|tara:strand:+ start:239 stop:1417 length:1179 start_codon:yes stop_codon:yes gene_type:complete